MEQHKKHSSVGADYVLAFLLQCVGSLPINREDSPTRENKGKIIDFLSRINGGIFEIPSLDLVEDRRDRRVDKICLTLSLLQQKYGKSLQLVPWALLRFIGITKFRYGVRSISHLIDLISYKGNNIDKLLTSDINIPLSSVKELKESSLAYHIIVNDSIDKIVTDWSIFSSIPCLVRFEEAPKEETA